MKAITLIAAAGIAGGAYGNIVVDDFDGGGSFLTRTITPDNSSNNGAFASSGFDVFGITNRTVNNDFADDSAGSFPPDTFGVLKVGKTDNVFGVEDLQNGDNPNGGGSAEWTVDISSLSGPLSLQIDFAAMGDMENGDNDHLFEVDIDGNGFQAAFLFNTEDSGALDGIYTYTMEGGAVVQINDPLFEVGSGTFLNNDFQTLSSAIAGSGSTLTLRYTASANNGGSEVFVFDNIEVVPAPASALLLAFGGLVATRRR